MDFLVTDAVHLAAETLPAISQRGARILAWSSFVVSVAVFMLARALRRSGWAETHFPDATLVASTLLYVLGTLVFVWAIFYSMYVYGDGGR